MSSMIEHVGVLLKADDEEQRQLAECQFQQNAALDTQRARSQKRAEDLKSEVPKRFQEIADVYPTEFSYMADGPGEASAGPVTCELVWTKQPPRRHLRVILATNATYVSIQWVREGLKEDYLRKVDVEKFDASYLEELVTELISSKRWGQGFYPII